MSRDRAESPLQPAEQLATDEALLEWCELHPEEEVLRFWESPVHFVVMGRSGALEREVDRQACAALRCPVLRRCSGGGTVVQGPGCLNYALVLSMNRRRATQTITGTNRHVMEVHRAVVERLTRLQVEVAGVTDLVCGGRKFSGNAQRRGKSHLLFHGTFLLHFDLEFISRVLRHPPRAPDYRAGRPHQQFVANLPCAADALRSQLGRAWGADDPFRGDLTPYTAGLMERRYSLDDWHRRY